MEKIFISYSRHDLELATKIKSDVETNCQTGCWMDMDSIESGAQFEDKIIAAIDNAKIVLFLLSKNSMKSGWARKEINYALNTKKKIVPVTIDGSQLSGWFLFTLSGIDIIEYANTAQRQKLFRDLKIWTKDTQSVNDEKETSPIIDTSSQTKKPEWQKKTKPRRRSIFQRFYDTCCGVQASVYLLLLCGCLYCLGNHNGYLWIGRLNKIGTMELIGFTLLIIISTYGTWKLYKRDKNWFWVIAVADLIEAYLICVISLHVYNNVFKNSNLNPTLPFGGYKSLPYRFLEQIGLTVSVWGRFKATIVTDIPILFHIAVMAWVILYHCWIPKTLRKFLYK